jgi:flagellar biosynthesis protein FlhA
MQAMSRVLRHTDLLLGLGLLVVVAMLVLPLPTTLVDAGLVIAIGGAVVILLVAVNVDDPMRFSVFPSLLLITTLFRLALSIAATKLILGTGNGGRVIETFGSFVMGGDFVVGFVAFLILVIVQFVVITNGAGRVSEVVARFTLDALPGKQMAIDADLAAGLIDEDGARARRAQVKQEADFYGAMDGASKFVKGDAIAAILIIAVNIVGGFAVGFFRGEGDAMEILRTYALLSVGAGIVAQIPALLISTSAGLLVTRSGHERPMGGELFSQLASHPRAIGAAGLALAGFGFVPGFPTLIFLSVGLGLIGVYAYLARNPRMFAVAGGHGSAAEKAAAPDAPAPAGPDAVLPLLQVDPLEIEVGHGLTRLADGRAGGDLAERIAATRRQIALELGFVMPSVRIRDNFNLRASEYVIKVRGEEVARGEIDPALLLAIDSGGVLQPVAGARTKEPVFGLEALWIEPNQREAAVRSGYTVIEPSAVLSTHLSEVVRQYAAELLSRQDVATLVDNAKKVNQAAVEELIPGQVSLGDVQKVLQHLLRERLPVRDMVTILETMADFAPRTKDPDQLGELVRAAMARTITRHFVDPERRLYCITLDPALERRLIDGLQQTAAGAMLALEPEEQQRFLAALQAEHEQAAAKGHQPVVLCGTQLRLALRRLLDRYMPGVHVLAYNEVSARAEVEFVGQVK